MKKLFHVTVLGGILFAINLINKLIRGSKE